METRKIVIVDSSSNRKVELNTDATTLGELKRAARAAGINYEGKDWLEGITKSVPTSDDSLLPTNVTYKGTVTNNLAYMLTDTNKKIKSGSERDELYAEIKRLGLIDEVRKSCGRNYTTVSNAALVTVINKFKSAHDNIPVDQEMLEYYKSSYEQLLNAFAIFCAQMPKDFLDKALEKADSLELDDVQDVNFSDSELDAMFGNK